MDSEKVYSFRNNMINSFDWLPFQSSAKFFTENNASLHKQSSVK